MMSRGLLVVGCVLILGAFALLAQRPAKEDEQRPAPVQPAPGPEFPHFVVAPYLQYATRTSITIMWETSIPGTSTVRYGVGLLTKTVEGPKNVTLHEVTLTDLEPDKPHLYQVQTQGEGKGKPLVSPLLTFSPAVGPDQAFSFVLFGDTQKNPAVTKKIATLAWQRRPNFVVHLGDVVDNGPDKREWVDELFAPCRELFGRVPVYPCIGNHEKDHANYYRYFALPAPEYHYSYRYGNAEFFVLDSNKPLGPKSAQYAWLDDKLAKSTAKWKFATTTIRPTRRTTTTSATPGRASLPAWVIRTSASSPPYTRNTTSIWCGTATSTSTSAPGPSAKARSITRPASSTSRQEEAAARSRTSAPCRRGSRRSRAQSITFVTSPSRGTASASRRSTTRRCCSTPSTWKRSRSGSPE